MRLVINILFIFGILSIQAQDFRKKYELQFNQGRGFIIAHNPTMQFMTQERLDMSQIKLEFLNYQEKNWQKNFPTTRYGIEFSHFDFNNPILGHGFSLAHYFSFRLIQTQKFQLRFNPILGVGFIENPFEALDNTKNVAIGSHANIFVALAVASQQSIYKRWTLNQTIRFNHFSNTGFKVPNLGINMPTVHLGIGYTFDEKNVSKASTEAINYLTSPSIDISSALGINQVSMTNDIFYVNQFLSLTYLKPNSIKSTYLLGIDYFHSPGNQKALEIDSIYKGNEVNQQVALTVGHNLVISKVSFRTQLGFYVYNRNVSPSNFYYTVGGSIFIHRKVYPFLGLKTHNTKAEYFFVGLRYRFRHE